MADFNEAIKITLGFEGGFTDDPADPGGATNFGITQADLPGQNIRSLTEQGAINYYSENYWKPLYSQINCQPVANKIFDMGVNIGVGTAVKILQKVLSLPADGIFGVNTLQAVNNAGNSLLPAYKQALIEHYQAVVAAKPETIKFLAGWIRRAQS